MKKLKSIFIRVPGMPVPESYQLIALREGEGLFVRFMVPEAPEDLIEHIPIWRGRGPCFPSIVTAKKDILAVVEDFSRPLMACYHLRLVRPDRYKEGAKNPRFILRKRGWELRAALQRAGIPRVHMLGGFHYVPCYRDEIPVADFSTQGSHGWIIKRDELESPLEEK